MAMTIYKHSAQLNILQIIKPNLHAQKYIHYTCTKSPSTLISGFHRAFLQSITFISRLMHSIM